MTAGGPRVRVVVVGRSATASDDFLLDDLPGTSGRLDVLVRCLRAALLVSHGVRRGVVAYLVLLGGEKAPRVVRVDGAAAQFVRPDERSLAVLVKKALAAASAAHADGFAFGEPKRGVAVAHGGLDAVLGELSPSTALWLLDEGAPDIRAADLPLGAATGADAAFFIGDHLGFDDATRELLLARGARAVGLGPMSVHSDDAIAVLMNELDRRAAG